MSAAVSLSAAFSTPAALLPPPSNIFPAPPDKPAAVVIAVQPNVPMDSVESPVEAALIERHYMLSESGLLARHETADVPRVVIWPESPMNFKYAGDAGFRELIARFPAKNHTSVL